MVNGQPNGVGQFSGWTAAALAKWNAETPCGQFATYDPETDVCTGGGGVPYNDGGSDAPFAAGAPARFRLGGVLPWGYSWAGIPANGDGSGINYTGKTIDCYIGGNTVTPDPAGAYHCAEGYAEAATPGEACAQAKQNAIGRLDCTHINWPRTLTDCVDPGQVATNGGTSNAIHQASTTMSADTISEIELLSFLDCQETGECGQLSFHAGGGGRMCSAVPVVGGGGGANACIPKGMSIQPLQDAGGEVFDGVLSDTTHVFIAAECEALDTPKIYKVVESGVPTETEMRNAAGRQTGVGVPSGLVELSDLQTANPEIQYFYMGSLWTSSDPVNPSKMAVTAHSGPLVVADPCCEEEESDPYYYGSGGDDDNPLTPGPGRCKYCLPEGAYINDLTHWNPTTQEWAVISGPQGAGTYVLATIAGATPEWILTEDCPSPPV